MLWFVCLFAVLALGGIVFWLLAGSGNPKVVKMRDTLRRLREQLAESSWALPRTEGAGRSEAIETHHDTVTEFLTKDDYQAALRQIEKALSNRSFDPSDALFAEDAAESFVGLADGKTPRMVLALYDKLKSKGRALAYAERHGQLAEMYLALEFSLDAHPEIRSRADVRQLLDLFRSDHPLMQALLRESPETAANFLDDRAGSFFADWQTDGTSGLAEVIADIEDRLN